MTLFTVSMGSQALHKRTELHVLVPETVPGPRRVLWALHGMSDDHTEWLRCTTIELLAQRYGLVVVMPNADLSFYVDMAFGAQYFRFLSEELPAFCAEYFGVSRKREDNFIIGNSMGGYGAFYTAMSLPEQYAAAISLSGPMRIDWVNGVLSDMELAEVFAAGDTVRRDAAARAFSEKNEVPLPLVHSLMQFGDPCTVGVFQAMFGREPRLRGSCRDIFALADRLERNGAPLKLLAYCGVGDYHYSSNVLFARYIGSTSLDYTLTAGEGGHDWEYWNPAIDASLSRLFGTNLIGNG